MRASVRLRNESCCIDLVYVDKMAKESNGVKFLLLRQDLLDRNVNAKGMKTKDSNENVKAFSSKFTKSIRPKKIWVEKVAELAGALEKFCAAEGIQVYSTMGETKAAFAERTMRSLKNILCRYMEDFGYKFIHKLPQFITTLNSRRNSSKDMRPKTVKNCDFMSIPYSKTLLEHLKPLLKTGDRVRISKYDMLFRKGYKPQFTREVFDIVAIATRKPPLYTIKDEESEIIQGKFHQKELIKVLQQWIRLRQSWFLTLLEMCFHTMHSVLLQIFYQSNYFWRGNGRLNFQKKLTHQCIKL